MMRDARRTGTNSGWGGTAATARSGGCRCMTHGTAPTESPMRTVKIFHLPTATRIEKLIMEVSSVFGGRKTAAIPHPAGDARSELFL